MQVFKIQSILTGLLLLCSLTTLCQNYRTYYKFINSAELESLKANHEKSIRYYDSAFAFNAPLPLHLKHALIEAAKIKDFQKCENYLNSLVNEGVEVFDDINSIENTDEFKASSPYKDFIKDYDSRLIANQASFDTTLINQLKALVITDQQIRKTPHPKGDTSYYEEMRTMDILNFGLLKEIVEKKGWPNYKKVGIIYSGVANIVLLHGSRYYSLDSKEWKFFEEILKKEIYYGHFYPITLAQWTDQHLIMIEKKGQKYGSVANSDGDLFRIEYIDNIDVIRDSILLEPLKDYMVKKGYSKILTQ